MTKQFNLRLTPREEQVMAFASRGVPSKIIARELGIAEGTVKVHLHNIYGKLGARSHEQMLARKQGENRD
jgi:DNA-binding NarL/FixJ family response regulator